MDAVNGYFYHVEFNYHDGAYLRNEKEVRNKVASIPEPYFFNPAE